MRPCKMIMLITMIMLIMVILLMIMMITTPTRHYTRPCKTVCFTIIGLKFFQRLCSWNGTSYNHSNKSNAYITLDVCDDILWRHKCTDIRSIDHLRTVTLPVRWDQYGFFSYHKWSSNQCVFSNDLQMNVFKHQRWSILSDDMTTATQWLDSLSEVIFASQCTFPRMHIAKNAGICTAVVMLLIL